MSLSLRHRQPVNAQRSRFGWPLISALLACLLFTSLSHAAPSPERVVVVANSADPVSGQIARYYMEKRGIPEKNLIELETSTEEEVTWDEFITTIYNPLRTRLVLKDWLSGTISSQTDDDGRIQAALATNNIDFLVLCRLPVKIAEDKERRNRAEKLPSQKEFQINRGSIDSELALMMHNNTPTIGFVANPLFGKYEPPRAVAETVVKVARLDGPGFDAVKRSLDSALEAERLGLRGRGYIDMGGPHGDGDRWIEQSGKIIEHMGYPVSWDKERPLIGWKNRVDAAAFYFGWWTNDITGVFADPAFRFPPGAIAFHIHSYSAGYIRRPTNGWAGPLIARGAATTVGNVFEPYLQLTHRPNLFIEGMMKGLSAGEAAYYSLPVLSWMTVCLGDPLYQPFKTDLDAQLAQGLDHPDELSQYAVLRKMKLMRADKQYEDSFIYGVEQNRRLQGIALAFSLARQYQMRGSRSKALEMLEPWLDRPQLDVSQWSMYYEMGTFLESIGENEKALGIYKYLITLAADTPPALTVYYSAAIELAHRMGETGQAEGWQSDLTRMQFEEQEKRVRQKMQNNRP
ncbi:TIGR03790 family protein [Ruficoccus amylovorans]|uniref:TIGR03790 family protein n=1 Tax=Ruficoccus amylovorans TaxID=1804625 RepID=A0A842HDJ0_9BACT|nr:TIGR03790 family protein [Ruficoccus amylovorans]MBC2594605.1 TIGR03790 family protein [Ruficoccus amylovorans]